MKKFTFTPLAIAVLALMSASCVNSNYNLDDAKVTATIEVNKNSELNSDSLLGFKEEAGISKDANGDFRIELPSKEIIAPAPVTPDAPVVFDGTLDVDMVTAPDIFHKSSGGEIANPGIKISISNPSPKPAALSAKVSVDGKPAIKLPVVEIPAASEVDIVFSKDINDPAAPGEVYAALPKELADILVLGIDNGFSVSDIALEPATKAAYGSASTLAVPSKYVAKAAFVAQAAFTAKKAIHLQIPFNSLKFNLKDYIGDLGKTEFKVNFTGTNYLPFRLEIGAEARTATGKLSGKLDKKLEPGTPSKGTDFESVLDVTCDTAALDGSEFDVVLDVTLEPAYDGILVLNPAHTIKIHTDKIKILK